MPFPKDFHRLVIIGQLYDDIFNTTLAFVPTGGSNIPAVTPTLLDNVTDQIYDWWPDLLQSSIGGGLSISASARLTSVKLNRIGVDGRYTDVDSNEQLVAPPLAGGGVAGLPPQLSLVATLRCPDERGLAGRGRMYFPPSNLVTSTLDSTGKISESSATQYANGVATLIDKLNDAYAATSVSAVAGVASAAGSGRFQIITKVTVGRVIDTMRSRRNKDQEAPVEVAMPALV